MSAFSNGDLHSEENDERETRRVSKPPERNISQNSYTDQQYHGSHAKRQRYSPEIDACLDGYDKAGARDEADRRNVSSSMDQSGELTSTVFRGKVQHNRAVSVRGDDGLSHYGLLIRKERDGFLVDFRCGPNRIRIVPFGTVFRLKGVFSAQDGTREENGKSDDVIGPVLKENDNVEVLLQLRVDEPWKWHPGTLITADFEKRYYGHVTVFSLTGQTASVIVPGQQLRLRPSESEVADSLIQSTDSVDWMVHYPLPLDFNVNHLPNPLLAEVLECLDTVQQTRVRGVCSLWDSIVVVAAGTIIRVERYYSKPVYWHNLWITKTRVIVVDIEYHGGLSNARECAILLKQIIDLHGYPRLLGVGLRGLYVGAHNSEIFCHEVAGLKDALATFAPVCSFIRLFDQDLHSCSLLCTHTYRTSVRDKWINVSKTGFSQRFARSLSVRYRFDGKDETIEAWINELAAESEENCINNIVDITVSNHPVPASVKHSGMPFGPASSTSIYIPNGVAVRGDDGLLCHAQVVAKERDGLLVDFCNQQPFVFVPFGTVHYYPNCGLQESPRMNESVEVLLQLKKDEPWKWFPATCTSLMQIDRGRYCPFQSRFVKVSVGNGSAFVSVKQLRAPRDAAVLIKDGYLPLVEAHRRLPCKKNIKELPLDVLQQVLSCLETVAFFKVRSVCKLWNQIITTSTIPTVHLRSRPRDWIACLNKVWSRQVTTVVLHTISDGLDSVCHLLRRYVLQRGGSPLQTLVLQDDTQLSVCYEYGVGVRDQLACLASCCQRLIFRKAFSELRVKFDDYTGTKFVYLSDGIFDLSTTDRAAQFWTMIAKHAERVQRNLGGIRWYFSAHRVSDRSPESVVRILKILNDIEDVLCAGAGTNNRRKRWSAIHLLGLQPEQLNGIAVFAVRKMIKKFCISEDLEWQRRQR